MTKKTPAQILQAQMEANTNVSIRKIATAANVTYGRLLNASKKPVEGQVYDTSATNYEAMAEILGVDKILDLDWDGLNEVDTTKGILAKSVDEFAIGDIVYMRKDKTAPFTIIHKTKTHIVVQQVDTETPYSWSNNTFMLYGPSKTPRKVETNEGE